MNDKKISQLPEDNNITGGENLVTEEQGGNFRVSLLAVKDWVLGFITTAFVIAKRPIKTINSQSLEGIGDIVISSGATSSDGVSNDSGVSGANVTEALETLQQEIPNPNNFVNKFTTDTQGVSGRLTVQTPLDTNTSDAASVGYVLGKTNHKVSSNTTGEPTGSDVVLNVVSLTQAEYDAGTPIATTFYLITDA